MLLAGGFRLPNGNRPAVKGDFGGPAASWMAFRQLIGERIQERATNVSLFGAARIERHEKLATARMTHKMLCIGRRESPHGANQTGKLIFSAANSNLHLTINVQFMKIMYKS